MGRLLLVTLNEMFDAFDLLSPRVVVVSETMYKERRRQQLEERKAFYQERKNVYKKAIAEVDKELAELSS